jgi:hypothetical protein
VSLYQLFTNTTTQERDAMRSDPLLLNAALRNRQVSLWPNGVMKYSINREDFECNVFMNIVVYVYIYKFTATEYENFIQARSMITGKTCIKMEAVTESEKTTTPYVEVTKGERCQTHVGRQVCVFRNSWEYKKMVSGTNDERSAKTTNNDTNKRTELCRECRRYVYLFTSFVIPRNRTRNDARTGLHS